ncbi:hypothetical protein B4135_3135 [Caldibacillus debilis]|uniref:Uncharacterized protein n=1 Tax=Caldibacillus debilis TaxID=301148 RepID=A0A150LIN2_9BACI|nr:hypothetical protein B4135_3135 [Caldibacillus debilis]
MKRRASDDRSGKDAALLFPLRGHGRLPEEDGTSFGSFFLHARRNFSKISTKRNTFCKKI